MQRAQRFVAMLALLALLALPRPAAAQAFWESVEPTRSGGVMLIYFGKLGPRGDSYTHVLYAATPERPDGYYWYLFRHECMGGDRGASWGFMPWNGGPQQGGSPFELLFPDVESDLLRFLACDWDYSEDWEILEAGIEAHVLPAAEGVPEVRSKLRIWQAQQP